MKKPIAPRLFGFLFIYIAVFLFLALIQFTRQGGFTQKAGVMLINGRYRTGAEQGGAAGVYQLEGKASVFFGGLEFLLDGDSGFELKKTDGGSEHVFPRSLTISTDTAGFSLPGGTELEFSTAYSGGRTELRVRADFADGVEALTFPFKPLKTSRIRDEGNGNRVVIAGGHNYNFDRSVQGEELGLLTLEAGGPEITYGIVPDQKEFSPADFIIAGGESPRGCEAVIDRWRDQAYAYWNRTIAGHTDEDTISAYAAESIPRGGYKAAVAAVPTAFINSPRRTYFSSVYLGRMNEAFQSFVAAEREKIALLSRQINSGSPDFLKESHVFEFFGVRGYLNFMDDGIKLAAALEPSQLKLEILPGILEGHEDYKRYRHDENPFTRLTDQACFIISENIRRLSGPSGDLVLVFSGGVADTAFNLRLGKSLAEWAAAENRTDWAAVGRSIVLSVLSLNGEGGIPAALTVCGDGQASPQDDTLLTTAAAYRILMSGTVSAGGFYPRAQGIGSAVNGVWAWTAASALSAAQDGAMLDISVSFPVGDAHYMMIRGVKPFTKIQIYNIDYRTDPNFERYDSSGWVYQEADQVLLIKLKHRSPVEHVRIFY